MGLPRLIGVWLGAAVRGRRGLLEESVLRLRVWPGDLDLNAHMNNARYLALMDLGRVDVMVAAGFGFWGQGGRQPLVAASFCRYFKPLGLFESFELRTRVAAYDEKWTYFEQRFVRAGRLHALAAVKALMVDSAGPVPTARLLEGLPGGAAPSPPLPDWMAQWQASERAAIARLKAENGGGA